MARPVLFVAFAALVLAGCDVLLPGAPASESVLAEPIGELTSAQLATHLLGDAEFARVFGPADGLGPLFVAASCERCHIGDGKGHPLTSLTRFGRYIGAEFDPMASHGGPQLQHRSVPGYPAEQVPDEATGVTRLMPPAVTGLGFLEAVDDATLLALADPDDEDDDGISGVPNWIVVSDFLTPDPERVIRSGRYIGRFGKKASALNLLHQTANAYQQDMGVTTDLLPDETHHPEEGVFTGDVALDPEVSSEVLKNVVFYIRTLKVPPRRGEETPDVVAGAAKFEEIGCAKCHTPTLVTGKSAVAALSEKTIHPYSDMLLHDMGTELDDGYTEGSATSAEWRTAPLWGLGLAADSQGGATFLLHDGRAGDIAEAIGFHGGEGAASRAAFDLLSSEDRRQLLAFLESL